jgi:CubicO group peptidase (beta-lactamase class C family)
MRLLTFLSALIALIALFRLPPVLAARDAYAPLAKQLPPQIAHEMRLSGVKGLSIAVVAGQDLVFSRGFGYADEARRIPAGPQTVYRVGSVSKAVTSFMAAKLVRERKMALDGDIRQLVPDFSMRSRSPGAPPVTPRMLMAHHSGLPSDVLAGMWTERPATLTEYIPSLAEESVAGPPVEQFRYSNVGYSLLGRAMENVTGLPFARAAREALFSPLGMGRSSFVLDETVSPRLAKGYTAGREVPSPALRDQPAGSLYSTAEDLSLLLRAVLAERANAAQGQGEDAATGAGRGLTSARDAASPRRTGLFEPGTLDETFKPQFPGLPLDFGLETGLGWMLSGMTLTDGRALAWHGGAALPYQAFWAVLPDDGIGVVILANTNEAAHFLPRLALKAASLALEAKTGVRLPPEPKTRRLKAAKPDPAELARVEGTYAATGARLGRVWREGDGLRMWLWDREVELSSAGRGVFLPREEQLFGLLSRAKPDVRLEFKRAAGHDALVLLGNPMPAPFGRVEPAPIPEAWTGRLGRWVTKSRGDMIEYRSLEIAVHDGVLAVRIGTAAGAEGAPESFAWHGLVPVSDGEAVIAGLGTGTGQAVRAVPGGLRHSGYVFTRER